MRELRLLWGMRRGATDFTKFAETISALEERGVGVAERPPGAMVLLKECVGVAEEPPGGADGVANCASGSCGSDWGARRGSGSASGHACDRGADDDLGRPMRFGALKSGMAGMGRCRCTQSQAGAKSDGQSICHAGGASVLCVLPHCM